MANMMAHVQGPTRRSIAAIVLAMALVAPFFAAPAMAEQLSRLRNLGDFKQIGVEHCMEYLARHGTYFGDPDNIAWHPDNIVWLCEASHGWRETPPTIVQCFSAKLKSGLNWSGSIIACREEAGLPALRG